MWKSLFFQICFVTISATFLSAAIGMPKPCVVQNKRTAQEVTWNLTTTGGPKYLEGRNEVRHSKFELFEPQLFTRLFRKLLTRTESWKDRMKNVANSFVSSYFIPNVTHNTVVAGKEMVSHASHFSSVTSKNKKFHKRHTNKLHSNEEEEQKPFNFAPIVQFIPASLDLSNKILLYQPQVLINGSIYIEQNKDSKCNQMIELLKTRNRNN